MINKEHLGQIIFNTLNEFGLYSEEAYQLVYGTIIQESKRGEYLRQLTKIFSYDKHGVGIGQIEKTTFEWLKTVFVDKYPELLKVTIQMLEYDLRMAILFVRLRYRVVKSPIPKTLEGQAKYWKKYYNTEYGSGTVEQYINNYNKYS